MPAYRPGEAREWALENLTGVSGVTIPSFTADLTRLNRAAIAHDIEHIIGLGFDHTLVMAEVNLTPEENAEFTAIARDTAGDRLGLFFHAAFGTLADNIRAARLAEKAGADLALLSYPPQFRAESEDDVYEYTRGFCEQTGLGVMIFPLPSWGFERFHPAGMSVALIRRMLDTIPNIVAIKAEQGYPLPAGVIETYHHFAGEVVISCPIEGHCVPLMDVLDLRFSGTSNTQWMSTYFPAAFAKARAGRWAEAMEDYWRGNPPRQAHDAGTGGYLSATGGLTRTIWKYQAWLAGFGGGPRRAPAMRAPDRHMRTLRAGLSAAGLPVTDLPDSEFLRGRFPA
ncbi:dihydrodipicolinate synthase family protein [Streptomyces specialis]|uniref:dihydrodipicolinate synthase family protein n=1 Tax=Streptomyces specialis TaxID=498367 RepID=UPI00073F6AFE|nr:dihydrodipicolinate synthase family protein [Streptomyces specialis]